MATLCGLETFVIFLVGCNQASCFFISKQKLFTLQYARTTERLEITCFYGAWNKHHVPQHLRLVQSIRQDFFFDTSNLKQWQSCVYTCSILVFHVWPDQIYLSQQLQELITDILTVTGAKLFWGLKKYFAIWTLIFFFCIAVTFLNQNMRKLFAFCCVQHVVSCYVIVKLAFLIHSFRYAYFLFFLCWYYWSSVIVSNCITWKLHLICFSPTK